MKKLLRCLAVWPAFSLADKVANWYHAERVAYRRDAIGRIMRANLRARQEEESRHEIRVFLRDAGGPALDEGAITQAILKDGQEVRRCLRG